MTQASTTLFRGLVRLGHDNVMLASMGVMFGWGGPVRPTPRLVQALPSPILATQQRQPQPNHITLISTGKPKPRAPPQVHAPARASECAAISRSAAAPTMAGTRSQASPSGCFVLRRRRCGPQPQVAHPTPVYAPRVPRQTRIAMSLRALEGLDVHHPGDQTQGQAKGRGLEGRSLDVGVPAYSQQKKSFRRYCRFIINYYLLTQSL